jgi:hypothetical protein
MIEGKRGEGWVILIYPRFLQRLWKWDAECNLVTWQDDLDQQ